jgi:hypothetical protein
MQGLLHTMGSAFTHITAFDSHVIMWNCPLVASPFQMRKLRFWETKSITPGQTTRRYQTWRQTCITDSCHLNIRHNHYEKQNIGNQKWPLEFWGFDPVNRLIMIVFGQWEICGQKRAVSLFVCPTSGNSCIPLADLSSFKALVLVETVTASSCC